MFFYQSGGQKKSGKAAARTNCNEKFSARNEKFFARNEKNSYLSYKIRRHFGPKKRRKPCFAGSLLFAIQIYNIFRKNANRFNISQQPLEC